MFRLCTRFLLFASLASSLACDTPHVLVVGLDGANWTVLDPLIDAGHLPNIGALVREGARAELMCAPADPETACFCPPVWTSIATGVPFEKHRIPGLFTPSSARRVKAIWNVVEEHGGIATTVSYRATWPPEPAIDFVFTEPGMDAAGEAHFDVWGNLTHPAHDSPLPMFQPENILELLGLEPPDGPGPPAWGVYARDRIAMEALLRLFRAREQPELWERKTELAMITLHGPDKVAHVLWGGMQSEMFGPVDLGPLLTGADAWDGPVALPSPFGWGPIAGPYLEADAWLGELLAARDFDYVVFVSDHGMTRNPVPGFSGHHGTLAVEGHTGIFAVHGPGVQPDAWLGMVSVLDVAPTLAYLLGLPIAEDLPGRVLAEAFTPFFLDLFPPDGNTVPTWE